MRTHKKDAVYWIGRWSFLACLWIQVQACHGGSTGIKTQDGADEPLPESKIASEESSNGGTAIVPWSAGRILPEEVPSFFVELLATKPDGHTFYYAVEDPCASNENTGLSPTCTGGDGPWKDFGVPQPSAKIQAGDTVFFRKGTYRTPTSGISFSEHGSAEAPIRYAAYNGEKVVFDGGFDRDGFVQKYKSVEAAGESYITQFPDSRPVLAVHSEYNIVDGIHIRGCSVSCLLWRAGHSVLMNSVIEGSIEDGIKTATVDDANSPNTDNLFVANEFVDFGDQAIDAFAAKNLYIVGNRFHGSSPLLNNAEYAGTPLWTKGYSSGVWILENIFEDLAVRVHALDLGGCCWENMNPFDASGNLRPVAEDIHALRNVFQNIAIMQDSQGTEGALGVQGCWNCEARENLLVDVDVGFGIHRSQGAKDLDMEPRDITIRDNTVVRLRKGRAVNLRTPATSLFVDSQHYYQDGPLTFARGNTTYNSMDEWKEDLGFDLISTQADAEQWAP